MERTQTSIKIDEDCPLRDEIEARQREKAVEALKECDSFVLITIKDDKPKGMISTSSKHKDVFVYCLMDVRRGLVKQK